MLMYSPPDSRTGDSRRVIFAGRGSSRSQPALRQPLWRISFGVAAGSETEPGPRKNRKW